MRASPGARKLALTAHVVSSVGWLGAVAATLALGIVAMTSRDEQTVRAVYLALEAAGWSILVPLSFASLLTGLLQGVLTTWGIAQHYWVVTKLLINVFATGVLLLYMQTLGALADLAASPGSGLEALRTPSAVVHASGALVLLLAATGLSVYKPRGRTRHGWRVQQRLRAAA